MANVEQREMWNGVSGAHWVQMADRYDRMLAPWGEVLSEVAAVAPGERVLDIGCGNGATTRDAARRCGPDGMAVGVDLSGPMVAEARERAAAEGVGNVRFEVGDAQLDDLGDEAYDVAISRFGIMFFDDPVAAFVNIGRAVRPGGRLAVLAWTSGDQQEWLTVPGAAALQHVPMPDLPDEGAPGPFSLAVPEHTTKILGDAGWRDVRMESHQRPEVFGGVRTLDEAMEFLVSSGPGRTFLADVDPPTAEKAIDAMRAALAERLTPDGVALIGTAWSIAATR